MDAILDEALDELDDDCNGAKSKSNEKLFDSKQGHEDIQEATAKKCNQKKMERTEQNFDAEGQQQYQPQTVEGALGILLEEMNRTNIEELGQEDDFLREMLGLADSGTNFLNEDAVDSLVDGMMEQLLSKELMYEPMKQVLVKFPGYLNENQGNLETEEYRQ